MSDASNAGSRRFGCAPTRIAGNPLASPKLRGTLPPWLPLRPRPHPCSPQDFSHPADAKATIQHAQSETSIHLPAHCQLPRHQAASPVPFPTSRLRQGSSACKSVLRQTSICCPTRRPERPLTIAIGPAPNDLPAAPMPNVTRSWVTMGRWFTGIILP